ncbi:MAG: hypothetical protein ACOY9D_01715 [Pseudomonadota bacterium]
MPNSETCTDCGLPLESTPLVNGQYHPCPDCGSVRRTFGVAAEENATVRDGVGLKAKRLGEKKPYIETLSVPSFSDKKQKVVHHERIIDRDKDLYFEQVTDYETEEVIHRNEEPLSAHRSHGTAKTHKKPE